MAIFFYLDFGKIVISDQLFLKGCNNFIQISQKVKASLNTCKSQVKIWSSFADF